MKSIDLVLSPDLLSAYPPDDNTVYVMADILRASSTIVAAFANGAKRIFPLETVDEARDMALKGYIVGAERNVVKCDFATLGNDPLEYTSEVVSGNEIYFTTTNGTRTIKSCFRMMPDTTVLIGAFTNLSAVAKYCADKNVLVVAAGWKGRVSLEDALYGAALASELTKSHYPGSDAIRIINTIYDPSKLVDDVKKSDHYGRLVSAHHEQAINYCLQLNTCNVVPITKLSPSGEPIITLL